MNGQSQYVKELLQTDEEFHSLSDQHRRLDDRIHQLTSKPYLSEPEQIEEVTLKKQKLQLKDRMEDILRRRQREENQSARSLRPVADERGPAARVLSPAGCSGPVE